jgi:hypothetical protein
VRQRELVERHRDESRVADDVAESCAGDARRALHVEAADLRVLAELRERSRLADRSQLLGVLLGVAVGRRLVRRVRDERERRLALRLGGRYLLFDPLELGLDAL